MRIVEKEYLLAVRTGAVRQFSAITRPSPILRRTQKRPGTTARLETFLIDQSHTLFDAEIIAYDTLRDIQGKLLPRVLARVLLSLSLPDAGIVNTDAAETELLCIKGIVLQYIDGFPLSKTQDHAPKSDWRGSSSKPSPSSKRSVTTAS